MADLYPILVDTREQTPPSAVRVKELNDRGIPAQLQLLPVADYHWAVSFEDSTKLVFVERKAVPDLLSSEADGRLARFVDETGGLEPDRDIVRAILVEGDTSIFGNYGYRDWTPESIDNLLVSLQSMGVRILRSTSVRTSADRLASFWKYTGRDDHGSLLRVMRPSISDSYMNPNKKAAVRMLMCLPNWGEQRARAALEYWGSVHNALEALADAKAYKDVKGVGPGLVKGAADFVGQEF